MKTSAIRIGNSRGIRIPKALLEQCRRGSTEELEVRQGQLVVKPAERPRSGWEEAFKEMARSGSGSCPVWALTVPARWAELAAWRWTS